MWPCSGYRGSSGISANSTGLKQIRSPSHDDVRDPKWRAVTTADCADTAGLPASGLDYFHLAVKRNHGTTGTTYAAPMPEYMPDYIG
jgi:hypothetical protein